MKSIEALREMVEIQGTDGLWNENEYMLGYYNGLELALATMEDREPVFRQLPAKEVEKEPGTQMPKGFEARSYHSSEDEQCG